MSSSVEIKWTKVQGGTQVLDRDIWTGNPTRRIDSPSRYTATGPVTGNEYEITQVGNKWHFRIIGKPGTSISTSLRNAKENAEWREQDAGKA